MSNADFVLSLADPVGWLDGVLGNFVAHGFDPETCTIRRGKRGTGRAPNYKIEEPSRLTEFPFGYLTETPGRTFNGRHHREMTWLDDLERHDEHWSEVMTFNEVKALLLRH